MIVANFIVIGTQSILLICSIPSYINYRGDLCEPLGRREFCEYLGGFFAIIPCLILTCKTVHMLIFYIATNEVFDDTVDRTSDVESVKTQATSL